MASSAGLEQSAGPAGGVSGFDGLAPLHASELLTASARAATPKDGSLQRALYSPHFAGNCAARAASVPASPLHMQGAGIGRREVSDSAPSKKTPVQFRMQVGEDRLREDWASERLPGGENSELAGIDIGSSRLWKKRGGIARHSPMHEQRSNASSRNASRPVSRSTSRSAEALLEGRSEPPAAVSGPAAVTPESDAMLMMPPPLSKPPPRRRQE